MRRAADLEPGATVLRECEQSLRSSASGGAFGIASVVAVGEFSFRVFLFSFFFTLFSILYRATVPVSFFL